MGGLCVAGLIFDFFLFWEGRVLFGFFDLVGVVETGGGGGQGVGEVRCGEGW